MKSKGVKIFFSTELPDNYAATLAKQFQQQNFKAINIEGAAYSAQLLSLAGSAANNMYIEQGYALYLGQDAKTVPAVGAVRQVDEEGRLQAELRDRVGLRLGLGGALRPGPEGSGQPTHPGRPDPALNKVTFFDAGGLVPPSDPAKAIPSGCFLLAQVQNGKIDRVAPSPTTGFVLWLELLLQGARVQAEVRPLVVGGQHARPPESPQLGVTRRERSWPDDRFFSFLIAGIVFGAIYAVSASGLVVTYNTTGIFNFAHGAMGMVMAYCSGSCGRGGIWPELLSLAVTLFVAAPVLGVRRRAGRHAPAVRGCHEHPPGRHPGPAARARGPGRDHLEPDGQHLQHS